MPVILTHDLGPKLNYGSVERRRLQHEALIEWLWRYHKTQQVVSVMVKATKLGGHMRRLRTALHRKASSDRIKALDQELFDAILPHRQTIGSTFNDHVRNLIGQYVPWVAAELLARFLTHVQASACGKQVRANYTVPTMTDQLTIHVPKGATIRERRAAIRRAKDRGRFPHKKTTNLLRDVDWYCRHVIGHETLYRLAKAYMKQERPHAVGSYNGHRLVLLGIRNTAQRLELPDPTSNRSK